LSKLQIYEVSKGVSEILPKFPHEVVFRASNYGTLLLTFFLRNGRLEIPVELVPCRESRRPCGINSIPASQVETVEVETFLEQSRFSNSHCGEVIHRVFILGLCSKPSNLPN
jgi:hypothetical protein